ncbi:MerR family transcriptional regulator [Cellvibrio polysaccharolyticus]|uniref:MerR family transcriptional regulator n=1 Tax=Cellvibrio polysaccharolyticus TaxID=2082724 RepID=A0A928YUJ3_9GAMM|nr:MerR family transcriptional regulator [Cellvibrio polysaccharolyticus]MBE8718751.1 MerR family transcriptional regulator [Cellvibrio polysaccharolyticus]
MCNGQEYSVSELSKLAGVSVRTLHHYDQIGLITPYRRDNGYREYGYEHLVRLQQIIIYRELDFSLADIGRLVNADNYDLLSALESQKALLLERQTKTNAMINSIEVTMASTKAEKNIAIMFENLPTGKLETWDKLTGDAYGISISEALKKHSIASNLTEEEALACKEENEAFIDEYVKAIDLPIESKIIQDLVKRYLHLGESMLGPNVKKNLDYETILLLADKMINDTAMHELHSFYHPDLSRHLGKAMQHYAEENLKDK